MTNTRRSEIYTERANLATAIETNSPKIWNANTIEERSVYLKKSDILWDRMDKLTTELYG